MQPGGFLQRDGDPGEKVSPSPEKWIPLTNSFYKYILSAYGIPGTAKVLKIRSKQKKPCDA